jgi:subtilisin family serine protease
MSSTLDLVGLTALMQLTEGRKQIRVGLIDGPVDMNHPGLPAESVQVVPSGSACKKWSSVACLHGTFVAGMLFGRRSCSTLGICPNCTLLIRPVFSEGQLEVRALPEELALAIRECVHAGAHVINLSVAFAQTSTSGLSELDEAFRFALLSGTLIVAAAGNQGTIGSSIITRNRWVIPVVACDQRGKPTRYSNIGRSIGQRGLSAPGEHVTNLGPEGRLTTLEGTSVAAPFVTGTIALLLSEFPGTTAAQIKAAITPSKPGRLAIVPPLLNSWQAYQMLKTLR